MENVGKNYHGLYLLVGFRTHEPQICHLGILNALSWRSMKKWQKQEGHFDLPPSPHKTLLWEVPPYTPRKGASLSLKTKRCWEAQTGLAKFPPVCTWLIPFWPIVFLQDCPLSIKPSVKIFRSVSLGLHFLMKSPVLRKTCINSIQLCFSPVNLGQFNFQTQLGTRRGLRKTLSSPPRWRH